MTALKQQQVSGYRKVPAALESPEIILIWRKPELQPVGARYRGAGINRGATANQRPTAASPFPQKVNTRTGVGSQARVAPRVIGGAEHGRPNAHRAERSGVVAPHVSCVLLRGTDTGWRAATPVRATDITRPDAAVMRGVWVRHTSELATVETFPTT